MLSPEAAKMAPGICPVPAFPGSPIYPLLARASKNLDCLASSAASSALMVGMQPALRTTSPMRDAVLATWFDEACPAEVHARNPPSSTRTSVSPGHRNVHQARDACVPAELSYVTTMLSLRIPQARAFDCSSPISGKGRRPDVGVGLAEKSVARW